MTSKLETLLELPAASLKEISIAFATGSLRYGVSPGLLAPFVGLKSKEFTEVFQKLIDSGCSAAMISEISNALHVSKREMERIEDSVYLTLSGPPITGIPVVETPTVVRSLFEEAASEVTISSYVFHQAKDLLKPLAKKMDLDSTFKVRFIVDLTTQRSGPDEPLPIVSNRFKQNFLREQWSSRKEPEFWYDPRAFDGEGKTAGVMHAKTVIVDESAALITSANFTAAAQYRNIEAGVLLRNPYQVKRLKDYFEGLFTIRNLRRIE